MFGVCQGPWPLFSEDCLSAHINPYFYDVCSLWRSMSNQGLLERPRTGRNGHHTATPTIIFSDQDLRISLSPGGRVIAVRRSRQQRSRWATTNRLGRLRSLRYLIVFGARWQANVRPRIGSAAPPATELRYAESRPHKGRHPPLGADFPTRCAFSRRWSHVQGDRIAQSGNVDNSCCKPLSEAFISPSGS